MSRPYQSFSAKALSERQTEFTKMLLNAQNKETIDYARKNLSQIQNEFNYRVKLHAQ